MRETVQLYSKEDVVGELDQDIVSKGFKFWRKYSLTLTSDHIHCYKKMIFLENHKTFDLRNIDSIYIAKQFNGFKSFILCFVAAYAIRLIQIIWEGYSLKILAYPLAIFQELFSPLEIYEGLKYADTDFKETMYIATYALPYGAWLVIFVILIFKKVLLIKSNNDQMTIVLSNIYNSKLIAFVRLVMDQKRNVQNNNK